MRPEFVVTVGVNETADIFYSGGGSMLSYDCLARGGSRDRLRTGGDTPFGEYEVTGYVSGKLGVSYGTGKISMEPVAGANEALDADPNRTLLRIHGGGNPRRVPDPYADHQPLISTEGCVRMFNADVQALGSALKRELKGEKDYVYVGTPAYLQIMSHTSGP